MCKFTTMDVMAIQECLDAYKKLIEWMPAPSDIDMEMKSHRLSIIRRLDKLCEESLRKELINEQR